MANEKLRTCDCGSTSVVVFDNGSGNWRASCFNCSASTSQYRTRKQAITVWNCRAPAEVTALRAEVERLREALGDIQFCRLPGIPDGCTVTMDQVGTFATQRARTALGGTP